MTARHNAHRRTEAAQKPTPARTSSATYDDWTAMCRGVLKESQFDAELAAAEQQRNDRAYGRHRRDSAQSFEERIAAAEQQRNQRVANAWRKSR